MAKRCKLTRDECSDAITAPDWSSLPSDLILQIGDIVRGDDDIDHYMSFRAVCGNWRRATAGADPRVATIDFLPSRWIMLKHSIVVDCGLTLVNVSTGRFLRKRIPLLRRYYFIGVTQGCLLVLGEGEAPHETRVLNPFTGTIFNFRAPMYDEPISSIVVTSSPMMVFISNRYHWSIRWADQSSERFEHGEFKVDCPNQLMNMTLFAGNVHVTNHGCIISTTDITGAGVAEPFQRRITMYRSIVGPNTGLDPYNVYYLVESGGDLLLVSKLYNNPYPEVAVYKVDTVNRTVTPVRSIGYRAIFVSCQRCLSVDARKFYTVKPGSIYYVDDALIRDANPDGNGWGEPISDVSLLCPRQSFDTKTLMEVFAYYSVSIDDVILEPRL